MQKKVNQIQPNNLKALLEAQKKRSLELRKESWKERRKRIKDFGDFVLANRDRISEAVHKDFKKPLVEVDLSELYPVIAEVKHAVENLADWVKPEPIDAPLTYLGTRSEVRYEPKGVCLIISPWNFPVNLCFGPLISCLAAGNTAILKPSELTPHTSQLIKSLVAEFFEEDLVTVVEGGSDVSTELLKLPFDHIFFTGSTAVGKIIMRAAAENLSSVTLELGGKSPTIIDTTANLQDAARRIAFGKFLNNGQTCIAPDYVLIQETVKEEFITLLKKNIQKMFGEKGNVDTTSSSYARIVNQKHYQRVDQLIQDAIQQGAKVEFSGEVHSDQNFIPPTVLTNVSLQSKIMDEEIFGPVLPIINYSTDEELIKLINDRPKPLALYIFSAQKKFQRKIIEATSAGSVCINDCVLQFTHPNLPFGGVNASGIGKSHGRYGFLAFSNEKAVLKQRTGFAMTYLLHPPYTKTVKKLLNLMIRWF